MEHTTATQSQSTLTANHVAATTDLYDGPLLHHDGVVGRGAGAPLLVDKQALHRPGDWLTWRAHTHTRAHTHAHAHTHN